MTVVSMFDGMRHSALVLTLALAACAPAGSAGDSPSPARNAALAPADPERVRALLSAIAHDSVEGRFTASRGYMKAAAIVAAEMRRIGLEPAGDSGYFQRIPVAMTRRTRGSQTFWAPARLPSFADLDTVPAERRGIDVNVVGRLPGSDRAARDSAVVVGAHLDGYGKGILPPVGSDSIYNGADDDASGVVAVLEIARALRAAPPRRTVVFAAFAGEEIGGIGSRWYLANPVVPLARTVAQFQIEMIARPDSLAGGVGKAWLTGYERSTMGEALAAQGIPIVADPRPTQNFFQRSDNFAFARQGIPAHTLSSFNLHTDYHRPSDDVSKVDFAHMTRVIDAATRAVRILADGPTPQWKPGGKP